MLDNTAERQLAAAILVQAFEDLAAPERTAGIYTAFFYTDYCKGLFDLAGIVYDPQKIAEKIAERPKRVNQDTKKYYYGRFALNVVNGYIDEITDEHGRLYHLENVGTGGHNTVSYYYTTARTQLSRGRVVLVEGV